MRKRTCSLAVVAVLLAGSATASAQTTQTADEAQADAMFKEAMQLRAAGQEGEACPKFAESRRLAPAVGVTLYLADCYEKTGRTASAWKEFRAAEKLAREHHDKRADVAAERAAALEPKLYRLTVVAPAAATQAGAEVQVDGAALPSTSLNAALAVDAGEHIVTFALPGQPLQTFRAYVDGNHASAMVRLQDAPQAAPAAPTAPAEPGASPTTATTTPSNGDAIARVAGVGLMVAGAAGIGIGTWLVTTKVQDMVGGVECDPHLRPGAIPGGIAAFSLGGVALISGVTLYYLHRPGRTEVAVTPAMVPGGAGAVLRTTF